MICKPIVAVFVLKRIQGSAAETSRSHEFAHEPVW